MKYNPKNIEKKWQKYWEDNATWQATDGGKKKKFYALIEFPYPSGDGMHVGHLRPITAMDVIQRKRRLEGYNSLYPIGMDSFGLPAENYAIKTNTPPQITTKTNIANFNKQLKMVGYGFDWSRFFSTTDQDYYRWTQWIFIQMFKQGLAYKAKENINWCPSCKIGLANEEVIGGNCERCGTPVEKKEKEQWILKITKYADRLISGLDKVDYLPAIKKQQLDWIGKSEGAEIDFAISGSEQKLKVFTTRPDTLFGVTFMAIAPEHSLIHQLETKIKNLAEVKKYVQAAQKKSDIERGQEKSGVKLEGLMAINPATKKEIPIFVADYVLTTYGTGAIMAVPAHDQRDWEFAKKYNLEIVEVIEPLFIETTGKDAIHAQEKFVERNAIVAVVKHWSEDKYLCLKWKNIDWRGFVIGGVEDGEDELQAAQREIVEETGFISAKFIKKLGGLVHSKFYHTIKKENRFAHFQGLYFELANDKQEPVSEKEQAIQEVKWFSKEEVAPFLNIGDMSLIWERLVAGKIYSGEGILVNSGQFNGLSSTEAAEKIVESVGGKMAVNYKLHDWIFSRQRYWGEPIPMVYCENCAKHKEKILMLHGWEGSSQSDFFPELKKDLEAKGYEVLIFDAPITEAPDFDNWYAFIEKKIKENKLENFHLLGHSMGGHLALKLAEKYKLKSLTLVAPVGFNPSESYFKQFESKLSAQELNIFKKYQSRDLAVPKVKNNSAKINFIFGAKDVWITNEVRDYYIEQFKDVASIKVIEDYGHMGESEGFKKLAEAENLFSAVENIGWQSLSESDLPLVLPNITDFQPTGDGQSPLSKLDKWVKTKCPVCGGEATRETDVMPNWAGSNWYFIRYTDPQNNKKLVDLKKAKYWLPVDWYNGGMEHTNLHLLYSRFVYKFLYDIKVIPEECGDEPYKKRTAHGLILAAGGVKMSKSKGNVIKPDDIVAQYGADTLRVYEMFMGPFDQAIAWDDKGVVGVLRFLSRVFDLQNKLAKVETDANTEQILHFTIKKVSEDIENMRFNTAVAQLMILLNHLEKLSKLSEYVYAVFIKLLSPFAPHLAEEVWQNLGNKKSLAHSQWPQYDQAKAQQKNVAIAIQIDGKIRDTIELAFDTEPSETLKKEILQREKIQKYLSGQEPKKFIHIKNKIISIVSK